MSDAPVVRLGLLRLTDAAPLILAEERGIFHALGVTVSLSVEPSWANIADKLSYGLLDGAVMLPPLALAVTLGSRGPAAPLIVPMTMSLGGNTIVFAPALAAPLRPGGRFLPAAEAGRRLAARLVGSPSGERPRLAVVHTLSTHNLLLRYWLAAAGIIPDAAFELTVVPPADMVDALEQGQISGFCAGPPWGKVAERAGAGRIVAGTGAIWSHHPEKCLAVTESWAARNPALLLALQRALLRAAQICDRPDEAPALARILAAERYVGVTAAAIRDSLPAPPGIRDTDRSTFFRHAATFPWISHALWMIAEMKRWGYIADAIDAADLACRVYRPDLYAQAAVAEGIAVPCEAIKAEGSHDGPWTVPARPEPIAMLDDRFCDGTVYPA